MVSLFQRPSLQIRCMGLSISHKERDRKSTRLNSSHVRISYAVFCLKKKKFGEHTADNKRDRHSGDPPTLDDRHETSGCTAPPSAPTHVPLLLPHPTYRCAHDAPPLR